MLACRAHVDDRQADNQFPCRPRDIPTVGTLAEIHVGNEAIQGLKFGGQHRQRLVSTIRHQHAEASFFERRHEHGLNEHFVLYVKQYGSRLIGGHEVLCFP